MSMSSGVGGLGEGLQWLGVSSAAGSVTEVYGESLSAVAESPWLTKSEKERIEDLLLSGSLAIPPPQINIAAFQDIAIRFPERFSLTALCSVGGAAGIGAIEGAAVLAALAVWSQSQNYSEADFVQGVSADQANNPIEIALEKYVAESPLRSVNALALLATLRRQTELQSAVKSASGETIDKAVKLAEQQLIISFLLNWSASEAKLAQRARDESVHQQLAENEYMRQVISDYVRKAELTQTAMKDPGFSILIGGLSIDAGTSAAINSIIPFGHIEGGILSIPASLDHQLNTVAGGVITAATMWSAPTALSLVSFSRGLSLTQLQQDSAKAFAISLGTLVSNPEFDTLISSVLSQAVAKGQITQSRAETISAAFKASLLLTAMASLYKSEYGGVTGGELRAIITGEMTLGESDFCGVLAKLINEQLAKVPPEDREKVLDELLSPYEQEAPIEEITQPLADFLAGWDPSCFRDASLASPG